MVKLADKTSNLGAIAFSPSPNRSVKRRLEYIDWAKDVVAGLRGVSPWLEEQFDRAAADAERSVAVAIRRPQLRLVGKANRLVDRRGCLSEKRWTKVATLGLRVDAPLLL